MADRAEVKRILDQIARRLLDEQIEREAAARRQPAKKEKPAKP